MKFLNLVLECQKVQYRPKSEPKSDWDYIYESIWIGLQNEVQLKALLILTKMFLPLKVIAKLVLKEYLSQSQEGGRQPSQP